MSQDRLGLFDTPPNRRQVRLGQVILAALIAWALILLPFRNVAWSEVDGFIPMADTFMFIIDLVTAALLYAQASVFRSRALTVLASAYVFSALLVIPHALTFPGAFAANGLLGAGVNTAAWLANFRRMSIPFAIICYVVLRHRDAAVESESERPRARILEGIAAAVVLAGLATLLATWGHNLLPAFFRNRSDLAGSYGPSVEIGTFMLFAFAGTMLTRSRKSVLDLWLLVALGGLVIQSLMVLTLQARFTAGFYGLYLLTVTSHLVVTLALFAEANRLYAQLALASSARSRERDARLMSMDAVAAAIAHEVGQPLAALMLSMRSTRSWLTAKDPDAGKALASLDDAIDAGSEAFDVIKNTRALFATGPGVTTECDINELVRAAASSLSRELVITKVLLHLALDPNLPPVLGNPVQLQRVFVNLFTNALEALEAQQARSRRIRVRTSVLDGGDVLLEVSDNGVGFAEGETARIFDAFYTTKPNGTGLGLSLCRTIVEEHGGQLWASSNEQEGNGATLHLRLPPSRPAPASWFNSIERADRPEANLAGNSTVES